MGLMPGVLGSGFGRMKSLGAGAPDWVLANAILDLDFANNRGYANSVLDTAASLITTSRASVGYADNLAGVWSSFLAGTPRITDKGILIEEARTNVCLRNRDLTNAAWTKTNVTAALDQTGIDGAANSASSIVASAGNGTCLQAITLGSSARYQSAWVKRITGSGGVNMTMDNGATWTAVTVTAGWTRVEIPTQTLANPTVGFQIVTNGDSIAVDFVQNENSTFATSPILVTTVAVTRAADTITVTNPPTISAAGTMFVQATSAIPAASIATNQFLVSWCDGSNNNRFNILRIGTTGVGNGVVSAGGSVLLNSNKGTFTQNVSAKTAMAAAAADQAFTLGGVAPGTASGATVPTGINSLRVGGDTAGGNRFGGYIQRLAVWLSRVPNAQLQALTT